MSAYFFPVAGYPKGKVPLHWGTSPNAADLFAQRGTPVRAMVDGRVYEAGRDNTGGWYVYLIGNADTKSLHYYMAHLDKKPLVGGGGRVVAGQLIGYVGDSGNAAGTGPHLHIGIGKSIKSGSGPEGGAGEPWDDNNCNRYLQHILDTVGSDGGPTPPPPPPPPPTADPRDARIRELETLVSEATRGGPRRALEDLEGKPLREIRPEIKNVVNELERIAVQAKV